MWNVFYRELWSQPRTQHNCKWRYDDLVARMQDKEMLVHWLMNEGLMVKERSCPMCAGEMSFTRCEDRLDGLNWECKKQVNGKKPTGQSYRFGKEAGLIVAR